MVQFDVLNIKKKKKDDDPYNLKERFKPQTTTSTFDTVPIPSIANNEQSNEQSIRAFTEQDQKALDNWNVLKNLKPSFGEKILSFINGIGKGYGIENAIEAVNENPAIIASPALMNMAEKSGGSIPYANPIEASLRVKHDDFAEQKFASSQKAGEVVGNIGKFATAYSIIGPSIEAIPALQTLSTSTTLSPIVKNLLLEGAKDIVISTPLTTIEASQSGLKGKELGKEIVVQAGIDVLANLGLYGLGKSLKGLRKPSKEMTEKVSKQIFNKAPTEVTVEEVTEAVEKITKEYKWGGPENPLLENALTEYDEAIEKIQNHFMTNKLTPDEMGSIRTELDIDVDKLVKNIEDAENLTTEQIEQYINKQLDYGRVRDDLGLTDQVALPKYVEEKELIPNIKSETQVKPKTQSLADIIKSSNMDEVIEKASKEELESLIKEAEVQMATTQEPLVKMNLQRFTEKAHKKLSEFPEEIVKVATYEKPKSSINDNLAKRYTDMVDSNYQASRKIENQKPYELATNSAKAGGTVDHILKNELVDMEGKRVGDSLKQFVEEMPKEKEKFYNYLMHKLNIERAEQGKNVFPTYTAEMSKAKVKEYERLFPEFKKSSKKIYKFMGKFSHEWVYKGGFVSEEVYKSWQDTTPSYLPMNKAFSDLEQAKVKGTRKSYVNQANPVNKLKGNSKRAVKDPIQNIMDYVNRTVKTVRYNQAGQAFLDTIRKDPEQLKAIAEIIPTEKALVDEVNKVLHEEGIEGVVEKFSKEFDETFNKTKPKGHNIVSVWENGQRVQIKINDKDILEVLTRLQKSDIGEVEGFFRKLNNVMKQAITQKNPLFAVGNMARDIVTGYVYGSERNPIKYLTDLGQATKDVAKKTDIYKQYQGVGGGGSNFFAPKNPAQAIKDLTKKNNILDVIENFNNATETIPRLAEFKRILDKTGEVQKALFESGEVTTNFSKSGRIGRHIDSGLLYFNAGIQGTDKMVRNIKNNPIGTMAKGVVGITAPTTALYLINKNNPHYNALNNRMKDTYYLIPNLSDKDENGQAKTFIKIPKAREVGVLFGSLFERLYRTMEGQENSFKGFTNTIFTNVAPANPIDNSLLTPIINLKSNKDFANRTIVPMAIKGRSNRYQYDEKTSEIAKAIGDVANISPKQIDYLIDAYTGVVGDFLLPATTKDASITDPLRTRFIADPLYSNQHMTDFYDNKKELGEIATDKNFLEGIPSDVVTDEEKASNYFGKISREMSEIYDRIKSVKADSSLTKQEKENKIELLRIELNKLAEDANKWLSK